MPLIQSRSKKAMSKNIEAEMDAGKPQKQSIAIAYSVQKKNKAKKMAQGGMAEEPKDTVGSIIGYPGSPPVHKAHGGMINQGEDTAKSMVDSIMSKRKAMSAGGMADIEENSEETPASLSPYDDDNSEAAEKELYDDGQLSEQPMDSNEHGDEIEKDSNDMVSIIRRKMKSRE